MCCVRCRLHAGMGGYMVCCDVMSNNWDAVVRCGMKLCMWCGVVRKGGVLRCGVVRFYCVI